MAVNNFIAAVHTSKNTCASKQPKSYCAYMILKSVRSCCESTQLIF